MKVNFMRSYRSKKGNVTFVYKVSGTQADLEAFEEIQGDYHRTDDKTGESLWFTTRFIGKVGTLIITPNGKIVPDMSAFDQAASLTAQYGGNFGAALADKAAESLLGGSSSNASTTSAPAQSAIPEATAEDITDEELGNM